MTSVAVSGVRDFAALGERWRELEQRAAGSFFQSWTWTGCLAEERFPDPVLIEATEGGRIVALALFNRVRRRIGPAVLHLGETGTAALDCPYIEQNGVLTEAGREDELTALCLAAVVSRFEIVLSGIGEATLRAVRRVAGLVVVERAQASPFIDLASLRVRGGDYLAGRSANTRQQIRRSDRYYQQAGPIKVERAESVEAARELLDAMAALHQTAWLARGKPGSFAQPFFGRFHQALLGVGIPRGEVALLKISCGETTIGILYNFIHRDRLLAYQSGFAYWPREARAKPGLTCHSRAIGFACDLELDGYEFLAGEDRYKRSLADASDVQNWAIAGPFWSPVLLFRRTVRVFGQG